MRRHPRLDVYLPETRLMTRQSLKAMLRKHRMVYVKPVNGSLGIGVMKVMRMGKGLHFQLGLKKRRFSNFDRGYNAIVHAGKGKPYMVQKGIYLSKFRGRLFDIRLVVQRLPRKAWTVTGIACRVAHPGKIVTNGSQGGTIYSFARVLPNKQWLRKRLVRIGLRSARRLHAAYRGLVEIGLDLAVDGKLHPWIIEANTRPDPCPFTKLPDGSMLRKILRYQKAWGIHRKLHCIKARRGV